MIEFTYDDLGRLVQEDWFDDDTVTLLDTREYTYDAVGRLLEASDGDADDFFEWDDAGNLRSTIQTSTGTWLESDYDALNRRTSLTATIPGVSDPVDDFVNEYAYDAAGRTTRITQHGQPGGNTVAEKRIDFAYDVLDRYAEVTRYEDLDGDLPILRTAYTYDAAGRLTELEHEGADGLDPLTSDPNPLASLAAYGWTYDGMGRLASATTPDGTVDYAYDATSQLTGADHTGGLPDEAYEYDENGNRVMSGHTVGPNNQLLSDGVWDYEYDDEGNLVRKQNISTDESVEYTWDNRNQLTFVAFKDDLGNPTKFVRYEYDALGRKITKLVDDDADFDWDRGERYAYDAAGKTDSNGIGGLDDVVLVYDLEGSLKTRYLHGQKIDEIFADENALNEVLWALSDHQGTVRDLARFDAVTSTTAVVAHREIDSFGQIWGATDPATTNPVSPTSQEGEFAYAFTGRQWDADAGLHYYRRRWYDAATARFTSEDPIGFRAGDVNLGRYVGNSPTNFTDPSGLKVRGPYWVGDGGKERYDVYSHETGEKLVEVHYSNTNPGDRGHFYRLAEKIDKLKKVEFLGEKLAQAIADAPDNTVRVLSPTYDAIMSAKEFAENPSAVNALGLLPGIPGVCKAADDILDVVKPLKPSKAGRGLGKLASAERTCWRDPSPKTLAKAKNIRDKFGIPANMPQNGRIRIDGPISERELALLAESEKREVVAVTLRNARGDEINLVSAGTADEVNALNRRFAEAEARGFSYAGTTHVHPPESLGFSDKDLKYFADNGGTHTVLTRDKGGSLVSMTITAEDAAEELVHRGVK